MKLLMWSAAGLVALMWTLLIAVLASLAQWLVGSTEQAVGGLHAISQWPMPAWLAIWVDPALLEPIKAMMTSAMKLLATATPWLTPLLGGIAPLLWVLWAVIMLGLVAIAAGGHVLVGKLRPAISARF